MGSSKSEKRSRRTVEMRKKEEGNGDKWRRILEMRRQQTTSGLGKH